MQALQTEPRATSRRETIQPDARETSPPSAQPESVDIMVALMAALSSPDQFVIVERGGELYIEPVVWQ